MSTELQLPKPIADMIQATNDRNTEAYLAAFAGDAIVHDEGHTYQGLAAIKAWSNEKNIGAKITNQPVAIKERDGKTIVTVIVDGDFDKTGLPDPLLMAMHIELDGDKISRLSFSLAGE